MTSIAPTWQTQEAGTISLEASAPAWQERGVPLGTTASCQAMCPGKCSFVGKHGASSKGILADSAADAVLFKG